MEVMYFTSFWCIGFKSGTPFNFSYTLFSKVLNFAFKWQKMISLGFISSTLFFDLSHPLNLYFFGISVFLWSFISSTLFRWALLLDMWWGSMQSVSNLAYFRLNFFSGFSFTYLVIVSIDLCLLLKRLPSLVLNSWMVFFF